MSTFVSTPKIMHGGRPRAREPTFRIFTVANLGYTQKYRRSIVILSQ
jgi:hypothetical protein